MVVEVLQVGTIAAHKALGKSKRHWIVELEVPFLGFVFLVALSSSPGLLLPARKLDIPVILLTVIPNP